MIYTRPTIEGLLDFPERRSRLLLGEFMTASLR